MSDETKDKIPFVLITQEWLDAWLPVLKDTELKAYLRLAYHYNREKKISFPGQQTIAQAIGLKSYKPVMSALTKLEELGLIEALKKPPQKGMKGWPSNQYRMLHVDEDGYHRAERHQSSLKEALKEWKDWYIFYTAISLSGEDYEDDDEMLKEIENKYPGYSKMRKAAHGTHDHGVTDMLSDFALWFETVYFQPKYEDIFDLIHLKRLELLEEIEKKKAEQLEALREDITAKWDKVSADIQFCVEHQTDYINKAEVDHDDMEESIKLLFFKYGVLVELADRYEVRPTDVYLMWKQLIRENGTVGFSFDFDGFVESVMPPDYKNCLTEEEQRLMSSFAEVRADDGHGADSRLLSTKGITPGDRRDFKTTLEITQKAIEKAKDYLMERTTTELAKVSLNGIVRETGGVPFEPGAFAISDDDGPLTLGRDLTGLLDQITYEINGELEDIRQGLEKNGARPIPLLTSEATRARFEEKKAELEANMRKASKAS